MRAATKHGESAAKRRRIRRRSGTHPMTTPTDQPRLATSGKFSQPASSSSGLLRHGLCQRGHCLQRRSAWRRAAQALHSRQNYPMQGAGRSGDCLCQAPSRTLQSTSPRSKMPEAPSHALACISMNFAWTVQPWCGGTTKGIFSQALQDLQLQPRLCRSTIIMD